MNLKKISNSNLFWESSLDGYSLYYVHTFW
nr:MAG TPA: hypothetical protein [Caudoviricetes sp.]